MENFPRRKRLDLRFAQRDDGNGFTNGIEYFEAVTWFLSGPALMIFHNGRKVAPTKTVFRHVRFQRHSAEHFKFHVLSG